MQTVGRQTASVFSGTCSPPIVARRQTHGRQFVWAGSVATAPNQPVRGGAIRRIKGLPRRFTQKIASMPRQGAGLHLIAPGSGVLMHAGASGVGAGTATALMN